MEILTDENKISEKFIDEVLSVSSRRKKLIKNPRKKVRGYSFNALLAIIVSLAFIGILKLFPILDYYNHWLYTIACIISVFGLSIGLVTYLKAKNKISELKNLTLNNKLVIKKDFVEWYGREERSTIKSEDIILILINKYSICFIQKNDSNIIAVNVKYKNEIINAVNEIKNTVNENIKIVDNSDLY